jgi:hypothetical protein
VVHLAHQQPAPFLVGLALRHVAHDRGEEALAFRVAPLGDGDVEGHGRAVLAAALHVAQVAHRLAHAGPPVGAR